MILPLSITDFDPKLRNRFLKRADVHTYIRKTQLIKPGVVILMNWEKLKVTKFVADQVRTENLTRSNVSDAEEFARNHPARVVEDFAAHLNLAYSIQEKQTAREQIRIATASSLAG